MTRKTTATTATRRPTTTSRSARSRSTSLGTRRTASSDEGRDQRRRALRAMLARLAEGYRADGFAARGGFLNNVGGTERGTRVAACVVTPTTEPSVPTRNAKHPNRARDRGHKYDQAVSLPPSSTRMDRAVGFVIRHTTYSYGGATVSVLALAAMGLSSLLIGPRSPGTAAVVSSIVLVAWTAWLIRRLRRQAVRG